MKKWFSVIFFVVLGFIIHIFYIRHANEIVFNEFTKNNSSNYQIIDVKFHKGFLISKGSFILKNQFYPQIITKINLQFYNVFFSNKIIKGELSNPFKSLDAVLKNEALAFFTIKLNDNHAKLSLNIKDINLKDEGGDTLIDGGYIETIMNKNLEIKDIKIHFKNVKFSQFYTGFALQNLDYEQNFDNPMKLYDLNFLSNSEQEISFDCLIFNGNKINSFYSKNELKLNKDNTILNVNMQGKSNEIDINLGYLLDQNLNFEKTDFDIDMSKTLDPNFNIFSFFQKNFNLKIQNLTFEKNKQNIKSKGNINIHNNTYQVKLQIITPNKPDEIFLWAKNYGGLNQYFFKENNNFVLSLIYDNSLNPKLKINGHEFTNRELK